MILADSTVWIDHLRQGDSLLATRLNAGQMWTHPFIIGEIALGSLRRRDQVLTLLRNLPSAVQAGDDEVQVFIEQAPLYGFGIGYVDAHLLAAMRLTPGLRLWTQDRRLHEIALRLGMAETRQH
jgi:predicted nucleic acid-binding protein